MKIILSLLLILVTMGPSYGSGEKVYSASELVGMVGADPESILGKEVLLSSCGIHISECNNDDEDSFVIHTDNKPTYTSEEFRKGVQLMLFGTKADRRKGRRIGYKRCGVYQGHMEKNPYFKYRKREPFIFVFVAERVLEEHERDIHAELMRDRRGNHPHPTSP